MTVASAPEFRSLTTRSSSNSQGGLHLFDSCLQSEFGRRKLSTASVMPSRHFALLRGSYLLAYEANRSIVWGPHTLLKCLNFLGASCQSELSVTRDKLSAQMFAALRMYCVLILMS